MKIPSAFTATFMIAALLIIGCGGGGDTTGSGSANPPAEEGGAATTGAPAEEGGAAGGSTPAPSGEARKAEKVTIAEFAYSPDPVRIQEGGKVIWQNEDSTPHTATADDGSFDTGTIEQGKIGSATFKEAGTFTYHCTIHPTMHGTVEVVPSS